MRHDRPEDWRSVMGRPVDRMTNAEELQLARRWTFPEEDRAQFTAAPWRGGYRWFRSANVIDLWHYRNSVEKARICAVLLRKA